MKNHIIIKFIAVLLCAASLLGIVGCGMGIFALTEMGLYDKTVNQVYEEQITHSGRTLAHRVGMRYASTTLGGSPEAMLDYHFGNMDDILSSGFDPDYVGYALKDAEGNVLQSRELPSGDAYTTQTFEITGQYMHFVDLVDDRREVSPYPGGAHGVVELINEIPAEGATLSSIQISFADSSAAASGENIGTVFCNRDGFVVMRSPGWDISEANSVVTAIALHDARGTLIYEASHENGVGMVVYAEDGTGDLLFLSSYPVELTAEGAPAVEDIVIPEEAAVEATLDSAEATIPETVEETAADETAAEETTETAASEEETEDTESTEATAAEEAEDTSDETTPTETTAETTAEASEDAEAEAAAASEDSSAEAAEEGTEATEETVAPTVPETVPEETLPAETVPPEPVPEPVMINGRPLNSYQINRTEYQDAVTGQWVTARYVYITMPEMTLELHVAPGALRADASYSLLELIRSVRGYLLPAMGICLLILAICAVYLCCAAGRSPKSDEIRPGGLNRIPLDLYGIAVISGIVVVCLAIADFGEYMLRQNVSVGCAFMGGLGYLAALLLVGFFFACAAQFKTSGGFWWRHSLCGLGLKLCLWLLRKAWQLCIRLEEWIASKAWPKLKHLLKRLWSTVCRICIWFHNRIHRFLSLLPVIWQWIVAGAVMILFLFVTVAGRFDTGIVMSILFACGLVLYGAYCFGTLMETTRKMNKGDLDSKVDDRLMVGAFKEFAEDLNDLAGVAIVSAQKQLKSERMKTELITNVSHDIKTPLTSIINYVDLLRSAHTEEERDEYLEVLDRQSLRLKKLIDDLMDMSKASTGNMPVDITLVDAVESVNQALGEFSDKLDNARLTPVFRHTEETVAMMADGKLVWRVLSNLLSNAVKYAMPGTRLYIDLMSLDNKVVISLKNISRDELNIDAEELMERFVRGDDSRNTEGSGLGLNIAKSLMELQKGQLQLLVDGDLFKVTLIFPGI